VALAAAPADAALAGELAVVDALRLHGVVLRKIPHKTDFETRKHSIYVIHGGAAVLVHFFYFIDERLVQGSDARRVPDGASVIHVVESLGAFAFAARRYGGLVDAHPLELPFAPQVGPGGRILVHRVAFQAVIHPELAAPPPYVTVQGVLHPHGTLVVHRLRYCHVEGNLVGIRLMEARDAIRPVFVPSLGVAAGAVFALIIGRTVHVHHCEYEDVIMGCALRYARLT
jgi:hypothetical protein